jgi:ribonuclease BN (tRNA processing enzyme)
MTQSFFDMNEYDIATRIADEGRVPLEPLITPREVTGDGLLFEDENLRVTAALVDHPPVVPALAYRFDGPDRSIVISGDTRPSDNLIELARGADVLVHEVLYDSAAVDRLVAGLPNASRLKESIMAHHTTANEVGRVAQAAGVNTLVLSHFVPAEDPTITEDMWLDAVRRDFDGRIVVGRDLLVI